MTVGMAHYLIFIEISCLSSSHLLKKYVQYEKEEFLHLHIRQAMRG